MAIGSTASATATTVTIDTSSESSVLSAYQSIYVPAMRDTVDWTGSVDGCNPGVTSAESQQDSLNIINFDRALGGLNPVSLDPALTADAQAGALIMSANNNLSHAVPTSWACYTQQGADAAASSDLFLGEAGAQAIDGYMIDPGANNTEAGHRRWIMYPAATTMGTGSTANSSDLYVFGGRARAGSYADPAWVAWPSAGYFPSPLEPSGRWSLSGSTAHSYDFSRSTVRVRDASGRSLPVTVNAPANGYGADTIVFQVGGLTAPGEAPSVYTVDVGNILEDGSAVSHSYVVRIFNPDSVSTQTAPVFAATSRAGVSGYSRVGQVLRAVVPSYSLSADSFTYQWYRSGKRILNATHSTRALTKYDLGRKIQVVVTAHRSGYAAIASNSPASSTVGRGVHPSPRVAPRLAGSAIVGRALAANPGRWNPSNAVFTYQWYRAGKPITGATSRTHLLTSHDVHHTMAVKVTAHAPGYSPRSMTVKTHRVRAR